MKKKQAAIIGVTVAVLLIVTLVIALLYGNVFAPDEGQESALSSYGSKTGESLQESASPGSSQGESREEPASVSSAAEGAFSQASEGSGALSDPTADEMIATFGKMGEEYILHARQYQQGETQVEDTPSLGWDGDMTLLVKSATVLPYDETAEYEGSDPRGVWSAYASFFQDPCVLRLEMELENIDAHDRAGIQYQFNASMFRLSGYEDLMEENQNNEDYASIKGRYSVSESYFDKSAGTQDYWSFELQLGETMDFVLEFLIDRMYLEQQSPLLAVSLNREVKAGVLLDDIVEE